LLGAFSTSPSRSPQASPKRERSGSEATEVVVHGARFPTEIYTRGCHWIPRMFA
jgi:hypothetical protein